MRRFIIATALILAASAGTYFSLVDEVDAAPPFEVETYFYSDAGMTNEIGWRFRGCSGPAIMEGSFSPIKLVYRGDACSTLPSTNTCYICFSSVDPSQGIVPTERVDCDLTNAEFAGFPEC